MLKKNAFYFLLIIIYILFLLKDPIIGGFSSKESINNYYCSASSTNYEFLYNDLSKLLNLKDSKYKLVYSRIINRNIYNFFDTLNINSGSSDNLKKGDIAINDEGLIGIINKTYHNYSEVTLLTSSDTNTSVRVGDSYGILNSSSGKLYVKNIKTTNAINIGDKVYTSGLTSIPGNIYIGEIKSIKKDPLELEYILELTNIPNINSLSHVGVIIL